MVKGFRSFAVRESFVEYRNSKNNRFEANSKAATRQHAESLSIIL